jgi:hypothetical protein
MNDSPLYNFQASIVICPKMSDEGKFMDTLLVILIHSEIKTHESSYLG